MPGTTPIYDLPYAVDTDARGAGAGAIQDLAEAVEAVLDDTVSVHYANGTSTAEAGVLTAATPTVLGFEAGEVGGAFTYNGTDTFTYTGPVRPVIITAGYVAVFPTPDDENMAELTVLVSGTPLLSTGQDGSRRAACSLSIPGIIGPGTTLAVRAQVSDPATAHDTYLRVMAV